MKRAFFFFFPLLLFLLLLEGLFMLAFPQGNFFYEPDGQLGSRLVPGAKGTWVTENQKISVEINQHGFRGWDVQKTKPEGTFRIALIGDSYIEGFQVTTDDHVAQKLEKEILGRMPEVQNVEVLSFGVSGYGTTQEYLIFQNSVLQFQPDLVLLMFSVGNDIRNNSFALENDPQRPYYVNRDGSWNMEKPTPNISSLAQINRFFLKHSHLYRFVVTRAAKLPAFRKSLQQDGIPSDYYVYGCSADATWNQAWTTTTAMLQQWKADADAANVRFGVVTLTTLLQIEGTDGLQRLFHQYPTMKDGCWNLRAPNERLRTIAEAAHVPFLDLLPEFIKSPQPTQLHFPIDGHWNAAGHELAARIIASHVSPSFDFVP